MWISEHLLEHDLDAATPLLAAVAPHDLAGFRHTVRRWLADNRSGAMMVRTESGCIFALVLFRELATPRAVGIHWLRHVEIGHPRATTSWLLEAFFETAHKAGSGSVWIAGNASNSRSFRQHLDTGPGIECGFRRFAGGWISQLPEFSKELRTQLFSGP